MGILFAIPIVFGIAVIFVFVNMVSGGDKGQTPQSFDRISQHPDTHPSSQPLKGLLSYKKQLL